MFYATVCWASNFNGGLPRLPPLSLLRISIPGRGVEPHSRVLTARMQSFSFVLRGEKSPLTGWLTFSTRKSDQGFSGPLSSSLILSHRRQQKSREKFLFQRNFSENSYRLFYGYLSYFSRSQVHTEPALHLTYRCCPFSIPVTSAVYFTSLRTV